MPTRLLHVADLLLGRTHTYLGTRAQRRRNEVNGLMDRLTDYVVQHHDELDVLLIVGNLFASEAPPAELVNNVLRCLHRIQQHGVLVLTVPGSRDEYTYPNCVYREYADKWPGVLVTNPYPALVHTRTINDVDVHFYSMAYTAGLSQPPFDRFTHDDAPGIHLAALHGLVDGDENQRAMPVLAEALAASGMDYIALGGHPEPQTYDFGGILGVHPGMLEGSGPQQPGTNQLTVVELTEGGARVEPVKFPSRPIRRVEVDTSNMQRAEELDKAIEALVDEETILHVQLVGTARFVTRIERLRVLFTPRCYFFSIADATQQINTPRIAGYARERTIRGLYVAALRDRAKMCDTERQQDVLERALRRGLAAFGEDVS